jgi:hypothetical protein
MISLHEKGFRRQISLFFGLDMVTEILLVNAFSKLNFFLYPKNFVFVLLG